MGQNISVASNIAVEKINVVQQTLEKVKDLISYFRDKFNELFKTRAVSTSVLSASVSSTSALNELLSLCASNVNDIKPTRKRIALIVCNSYAGHQYALGEPAVNDGLLAFYALSAEFGYECFMFHDPTITMFTEAVKRMLSFEVEHVVVYYIGHGTSVRDVNGDEIDGFDEAFVFRAQPSNIPQAEWFRQKTSNGHGITTFIDDEMKRLLLNKKCQKVTVISDCCHSGTICDLDGKRSDIVSISACADNQTAKQDWFERKGNGVFSYYFWKAVTAKNNYVDVRDNVNRKLTPYNQHCVITGGVGEVF